jgi:glycerol-3-phosphate acyltransferase PlsX
MGGDKAPKVVLQGAEIARKRYPNIKFIIYGDTAKIRPHMDQNPSLAEVSTIVHTDIAVSSSEKPSNALRGPLKQSSMRLAIEAVKAGDADCAVSAGNTGALMGLSKIIYRMVPGIDRPAIASFFPTLRGESVMLDLGANIQCDADNLVQFAVMGNVFARVALGANYPTIGLLNVGSEELKGNDDIQEAHMRLKESSFPGKYVGFIEGDDIAGGTTDVVVTDGFTGNIALKTAEGTAHLSTEFLKRTFKSSIFAQIGYIFAARAMRKLKHRLDPRKYNGAMFLGLNGVTVKSHGGTDGLGFANAVSVAHDMVEANVKEKIKEDLANLEI